MKYIYRWEQIFNSYTPQCMPIDCLSIFMLCQQLSSINSYVKQNHDILYTCIYSMRKKQFRKEFFLKYYVAYNYI